MFKSRHDDRYSSQSSSHYDLNVHNDNKDNNNKSYLRSNRLIACAFAICLLWITSMQVCYYLVESYISSPYLSSVYDQCLFTYNEATRLKNDYQNCATRELQVCTSDLNDAYAKEQNRTRFIDVFNTAVEAQAAQIYSDCSQSLQTAQTVLYAWDNGLLPVTYKSSCSSSRQAQAAALIGQDPYTSTYAAASVATTNDLTSFSTSTNLFLNSMQTRFDQMDVSHHNQVEIDRSTIISQTLANSKLSSDMTFAAISQSIKSSQVAVASLIACVGGSDSSVVCSFGQSLHDALSEEQQKMGVYINNLREYYNDLRVLALSYENDVDSAFDTIQQFYESVVGPDGLIGQTTSAFKKLGIPIDTCSFTTPSWCSISITDLYVYPPNFPVLFEMRFPALPSNLLSVLTSLSIPATLTTMAASSSNMSSRASASAALLHQSILTTNASLVPPFILQGNAADAISSQREVLNSFTANISSSLQSFTPAAASNTSSTTINPSQNNTSKSSSRSRSSMSSFLLKRSPFGSSHVDFSFDSLLGSLSSLQNSIFLLDTIYRGVHTIMLIMRYWTNSVVPMPVLDLRAMDADKSLSLFVVVYTGITKTFYVWSTLGFFLAVIALAFLALAGVYLALFRSYSAACVQHSAQDTFLSATICPALFNYASSDGSSTLLSGIEKYNYDSSSLCSGQQLNDSNSYSTISRNIDSLQSSFDQASNDFILLQECVDLAPLDTLFYAKCGTSNAVSNYSCPTNASTGINFNVPSYYLNNLSCSTNVKILNYSSQLERSGFNCSTLPQCTVTCQGPDTDLIGASGRQCDCMAQWYIHSGIFLTALCIFVYLSLYLSSAMMKKGILMMEWRHLTAESFDCTSSCDENGVFLNNNDPDSIKYNSSQNNFDMDKRKIGLQKQIQGFEMQGYIYLVSGVFLNVLWMGILIVAKDSVAYRAR